MKERHFNPVPPPPPPCEFCIMPKPIFYHSKKADKITWKWIRISIKLLHLPLLLLQLQLHSPLSAFMYRSWIFFFFRRVCIIIIFFDIPLMMVCPLRWHVTSDSNKQTNKKKQKKDGITNSNCHTLGTINEERSKVFRNFIVYLPPPPPPPPNTTIFLIQKFTNYHKKIRKLYTH